MKIKRIAIIISITFFVGVFCNFAVPNKASDTSEMVEGYYVLNPQQFYQQALAYASGLCVEGVNSEAGQTTKTNYIASGGFGMGSWRSIEVWNTIYPVGLPAHQGDHVDTIYDMEKFEDLSGNMDLLYIQAGTSDRVVKQSIVGESFYLTEDWYGSLESSPIDLALGEFETGKVGAVITCEWGEVYVIRDLNNPSLAEIADLNIGYPSFIHNHEYRFVKNIITEIGDLDEDTTHSGSDVVVARDQNVTAISNNNSNQVIWDVDLLTSGYICSILAVEDQNADLIEDIVVGTSSEGIFLLSGADGSTIRSLASGSIGTALRDVQLFNSTHVITGNSEGYIHTWNLATGTISTSMNFGVDVNVILDVGDFDSDGYHEFAIGGDLLVGVIRGNNMTKQWTSAPRGSPWGGSSVDVYDLCIMDDMVDSYGTVGGTDGIGELGVIGHLSSESALFIYNTYGALQFIPDLSGSGSVDSTCEENGNYEFTFTATAIQRQNLPVTTEISIDDGTWTAMTQGAGTWTTGVTFTFSQGGFSDGTHTYKFRFDDGIDTVETSNGTFQVGGDCGGGEPPLDIPGAGIWMILSSIGIGLVISLFTIRKRLHR